MLTSLTPAQELALEAYAKKGIEIGLATGPEMDEALVREITDKHRILCDIPAATVFKVYDSPFAAIKDNEGLTNANALYGQHDINWLMHYQFFRTECGFVEETNKIVHLMELAKRVGWMWMDESTTIVTRRPKSIHFTSEKRETNGTIRDLKVLHNTKGLALEYADGLGVYALYGTRLSKEYQWLVTDNGNYTVERVLKITNAAIKTIGLRLLGPNALITIGTKINTWQSEKGGLYTLYSVPINGNTRVYLHGECPSKHEPFCEAVPPDTKTCQQALAWREEEVDFSSYTEPSLRT